MSQARVRILRWLALVTLGFGGLCANELGASPRVFVPVTVKPGAVNEIDVWDASTVPSYRAELVAADGKVLATAKSFVGPEVNGRQTAVALLAFDVLTKPAQATVRVITAAGATLLTQSVEITPRSLPREVIPLTAEMTTLRAVPNPRKDREAQQIWAIYLKRRNVSWQVPGRFRLPVEGILSSAQFGDVRHYAYSDGTSSDDYHRGTDFAAPVGTPVSAPAPGVVVLAADRMLTGQTIVLEHGPGVYSIYFHLSRLQVKAGDVVRVGQRLGLTGKSGLVTGPHLHWEVRVDGIPVDPLDLVTDGLLDTDRMGALISSIEQKRG